ncbi:hypothetical protein GGI25_000728 [Coemansia spiralis]|uniref:RWD domain-containing protein n=2 Tax=Coemansia TaxID=4863 RepID=A0A9W8GDR8_9FUNG|nr:hypothetical protein EDC05_000684 [Coemansia umbellata]KAJ2621981.1 hypothetical protein GGI26_003685 [Coemansia sp. RSA 1358]KAJ2680436.1 hypothetical protein GGI25_000728 [Coemansia spiralis]
MDGAIETNRQRQRDEFIALQAIFGESAVETSNTRDDTSSFMLHIPIDNTKAQADICFHLPDTYPSDDPPVFEWIGAHDMGNSAENPVATGYMYVQRQLALSSNMRIDIEQELHRMWAEDVYKDVVIFAWVSWLSEYLETHWPQPIEPIPLPKDNEGTSGYPQQTKNQYDGDTEESSKDTYNNCATNTKSFNPISEIFTGTPLEMKKSVFIGHAAHVKSAEDVQNVLSVLMENKKIAQATHNIMAYRIRMENGSISQDNDDDGETAAGKRLGHLLQLLEVENTMVVVTRWFGGTHLGPDRFKLINNAARQALETGGFLGDIATEKVKHGSNSRK